LSGNVIGNISFGSVSVGIIPLLIEISLGTSGTGVAVVSCVIKGLAVMRGSSGVGPELVVGVVLVVLAWGGGEANGSPKESALIVGSSLIEPPLPVWKITTPPATLILVLVPEVLTSMPEPRPSTAPLIGTGLELFVTLTLLPIAPAEG